MTHRFAIFVLLGLITQTTAVSALTCADLPNELVLARTSASDETATVRLTNTGPEGQSSQRELFIKRKLAPDGFSESILVEVTKPAETQGVKLLIRRVFGQQNQQWLYLPDFKKTKRVAESQQRGNFLGSEFAFSDLAPFDLNDYNCQDPIGETPAAYQIQMTPKNREAGFAKLMATYDKTKRVPVQIDFWDANNHTIKTAVIGDYREIAPGKSRTFSVTMRTSATGRQSHLEVIDLDVKTTLPDADFSLHALDR